MRLRRVVPDLNLKIDDDDFTLFGLPRRYALDPAALDAHWRMLQAQVHPDRHASGGVAAQRVAMQWAVRVNEAYRRLKDPLRRGAYLCELGGAPIDAQIVFVSPKAEYTPPIIYSRQSRARLVFLVEARPAAADAIRLHPGQPVEVALDAP